MSINKDDELKSNQSGISHNIPLILDMLLISMFWLCAFLNFIVPFVTAEVSPITSGNNLSTIDYPAKEIKDSWNLIIKMNTLRQKFAKDHDIANMCELTWDEGLAGAIGSYKSISAIEGKSHLETNDFEDAIIDANYWSVELFPNRTLSIEDKEYLIHKTASLLYPLFEKVGCAYKVEKDPLGQSFSFGVCLFSPTPFEVSGYNKIGEPGSKCPEGYENNDGLCSLIGPIRNNKNSAGRDSDSGY